MGRNIDINKAAPAPSEASTSDPRYGRPFASQNGPRVKSGVLDAFSVSLSPASDSDSRAQELEALLAKGINIVEIDPALIDKSPYQDRMDVENSGFDKFVDDIRTNGQIQPVLVRKHPKNPERYQLAFGRRRTLACARLKRNVLAIVRDLSDEQLVIYQGQENAARADLSFIERARFAATLDQKKFSRETIQNALSINVSGVSKLLTLVSHIPSDLIDLIGPAPKTGRTRWEALQNALVTDEVKQRAIEHARSNEFSKLDSDARIEALIQHLTSQGRAPAARPDTWTAEDGTRAARILRTEKRITITFDKLATDKFGDFIADRLGALYTEYKKNLAQ